jgi:hypothetical protein
LLVGMREEPARLSVRVETLLLAALLPLAAGCPAPVTGGARCQEAARDMNLDAQFGRMELAAEKVAPQGREAFVSHRAGWGGKVRIVDSELAGLKLNKDEDEAEITVRVAWQRVDEGDLQTTRVRQKWKDFRGDWKLVDEDRFDGAIGLLGEPVVRRPVERKNAQFPTIHIGAQNAPASPPPSSPNGAEDLEER